MSDQRLSALEEAWRRDPPAAFVLLAEAYATADRGAEAAEVLQHGLAARPGHLAGLVLLARLAAEGGDDDGALRRIGDVLALQPRHWAGLHLLAELRRRAGDAGGERDALLAMLEVDPEATWVRARIEGLVAGSRPAMPSGALRTRPARGDTVPSSDRPAAAQPGLPAPVAPVPPPEDDPFTNATMAELLAAQGDVAGARRMIEALVARDPSRQSLRERYAELGGDAATLAPVIEPGPDPERLEAALAGLLEE